MVASLLAVTLLSAASVSAGTADPETSSGAAADTVSAAPRIVRSFPPVEVRALLHDLRSSQTVHLIPGSVMRSFPVDDLADVLALQPGVVVQAEELHVRGGRAGETAVSLDGLSLNEPLRYRSMDVPLLALGGAELVSGAPEAQHGGSLAGVLPLRTVDPGERPSAEWRWQSDGRLGTHFDRISARIGSPLHVLGLGAVVAGDVTLDDTWLPYLRTTRRDQVAGLSLGWRAENRLLGSFKLAPVRQAERFSALVLVSRQVHQPFSPNWSLDGWTYLDPNPKVSPIFSPVPLPGYQRYRAADRLAMTDDRQIGALLKVATSRAARRVSLSLGWLRTRTVTSVGGGYEPEGVTHRPLYGNAADRDQFYVLWGDYPLYRESGSDVVSLRADGEVTTRGGTRIIGGGGIQYDDVSLREVDWQPIGRYGVDIGPPPLDSIRTYSARAPGAFAYVQGRWQSGGMVMNTGLRAEYFTPGSEATHQTLPGSARGVWTFGPRLGIAYPISVRDVFSLSYLRMHQAPGRDYLYDQRTAISNRQPLGNPAIPPATLISYEVAVKHLFGPTWALQTSVFYRDVFGQIGARDYAIPEGPLDLRYVGEDESNSVGFEWSVIHASGDRRLEARYTWMQAWGNESRPEGDPYGPVRLPRTPAIGDQPLSWDRRHSFLVSGAWQWKQRWSFAWSTAIGSPLPWTPKPRRQPFTDISRINSQRFQWSENTNLALQWTPRRAHGLTFGLEARNVFDTRGERAASVDGYPNPVINTIYDDYGAYRTETGLAGGAYWSVLPLGEPGRWVPVRDPRLYNPPRAIRASVGARW